MQSEKATTEKAVKKPIQKKSDNQTKQSGIEAPKIEDDTKNSDNEAQNTENKVKKSDNSEVAKTTDDNSENIQPNAGSENPEGSAAEISPFDRILTNADSAVQALLSEERHIVANQISRLIDYCHDLRSELEDKKKEHEELLPKIEDANDRMRQALEVSLTSENTVQMLKKTVEKAWHETDAAHLREQTMQEEMSEMYGKLTIYESKEKKSRSRNDDGNLGDIGPLANKKESILRERDRLQAEVEELEKRLYMQRIYAENLEKRRHDTETANAALMHELESTDTNKVKFKRRIEDLQQNLDRTKGENGNLTKKIITMETRLEDLQKQLELKITELQLVRSHFDKLKAEQASWNKKLMKRGNALNICMQENRSLTEQVRITLSKLKSKEYELMETKKDCKKSIANYDLLAAQLSKLTIARTTLTQDLALMRNEITKREKELALHMKTIDNERHDKDVIVHERDSLRSVIVKLTSNKKELEHSLMLRSTTIERLQEEVLKKNAKLEEIRQLFDQTVKERDHNQQEVEVLNDKVDDLQEIITLKAEQIVNLKNSMTENHATHMKTKQSLQSTNSERLILRQQLQTCTEERDNLKTQFTHVTYQVTQQKEEISSYQNKQLVLNLEIEKLEKEKQQLKMEIRNITNILNSVRNELKETKRDNDRLYESLSTDEQRLMKQAIKLDNTMHEKDLIGSQMIRRNDEIVLLKEQITILEVGLRRGQMQYHHRIEDIKLLKLEVMKLRSQRNLLTRGLANTADMRQEILQLHRLLLQERVKNQALQEEAVSPMNIHRWRPLKGRDPDRIELIQKIILLQRRTLQMHNAAARRENELHESHKLYMLLKGYIEKLPSFKVKEDLLQSQHIIRVRSKKLKAIAAELNAKEHEINSRDCAIENLKTTLEATKTELFKIKKKKIMKNTDRMLEPMPQTRTLGAGFKIKCL